MLRLSLVLLHLPVIHPLHPTPPHTNTQHQSRFPSPFPFHFSLGFWNQSWHSHLLRKLKCLIFFGRCIAVRPNWQSANYRLRAKITKCFASWARITGGRFFFSFLKPTKQKKNTPQLLSAFSIKQWGEEPRRGGLLCLPSPLFLHLPSRICFLWITTFPPKACAPEGILSSCDNQKPGSSLGWGCLPTASL